MQALELLPFSCLGGMTMCHEHTQLEEILLT